MNRDELSYYIEPKLSYLNEGYKLYSPLFGEVAYKGTSVWNGQEFINVLDKYNTIQYFNLNGEYVLNADKRKYSDKCLLFPTKSITSSWKTFLLEGMVLRNGNEWCCVCKKVDGDYSLHWVVRNYSDKFIVRDYFLIDRRLLTDCYEVISRTDLQELYSLLEKNGYGITDNLLIVFNLDTTEQSNSTIRSICDKLEDEEDEEVEVEEDLDDEDELELEATKETLTAPEKGITPIPTPEPKIEGRFKPFDRIMIKDNDYNEWRCSFFSHENLGDLITTEDGIPDIMIHYTDSRAKFLGTKTPVEEVLKH